MKVYVLYGSATGNAEQIAKDLAASVNDSSIPSSPHPFTEALCYEMDAFKKKKLVEAWAVDPSSSSPPFKKYAVAIVTSTTGNGDSPENASRFVRYMKRKTTQPLQPLQHVAYSVLALGDTNYDQFCEAGKVIDKKAMDLGGTRAKVIACADEATGLEDTVEPWVESVLGDLGRACLEGDAEKAEEAKDESPKVTEETVSKQLEENLVIADASAAKEAATAVSALTTQPAVSVPATPAPASTTATPAAAPASSSRPVAKTPLSLTPAAAPAVATAPAASSKKTKSPTPLYVLYGSATGNAEQIAKDLTSTYQSLLSTNPTACHFPSVVCHPLNDYKKKKCLDQWEDELENGMKHGVAVVCSTTGNADAPENSDRFVRWAKRKTTVKDMPFRNVAFSVLALGDTNYDQFCATGKTIDQKLVTLGGTRATPISTADEATGLEEIVEAWSKSVVDRLTEACGGGSGISGGGEVAVVNAAAVAAAPTVAAAMVTTSETIAEEKKEMDEPVLPAATALETATKTAVATSTGVATIRALLNLQPSDPLPEIADASLPTLGPSLSSCRLLDEGAVPNTNSSAAAVPDNMTISSGSSVHWTLGRPYASAVLGARYLTNTDVACAQSVTEEWSQSVKDGESPSDDALIRAGKEYERRFPLDGPDAAQNERNGKRVIEMTLSLPDDFTLEYEPGDSVGLVVSNAPEAVGFVLGMLKKNHGIERTRRIVSAGEEEEDPVTVEDAVRNDVDLCSAIKKKRTFLSLSQFATDAEERRALRLLAGKWGNSNKDGERDDEALFRRYADEQRITVVDVLREFPSTQSITLEGLMGCMSSIPPRYYSVCSSPLQKDKREGSTTATANLKVAFSVVDYLTPELPGGGGRRRVGGLATRYLECVSSPFLCGASSSSSRRNPMTINIFAKPTGEFRLPADMSTPLILIGPGTGIAPFMGFVAHRQAQIEALESTEAAEMASEGTWRGGYEVAPEDLQISERDARGLILGVDHQRRQTTGDIDLFFGCRHRDHDWLYQKETEGFRTSGILKNLYTAFSRDGNNNVSNSNSNIGAGGRRRKYVQDIMLTDDACGSRMVEMITDRNASVYVCGDGNVMGRDVQDAVAQLLAEKKYGGGGDSSSSEAKEKAVAYVEQMKTHGRFVLDIWS